VTEPYYDSVKTWLAHAPEDEIAEAIYAVLSPEQREAFLEELDQLLAETREH
jgi:hypothetical protein